MAAQQPEQVMGINPAADTELEEYIPTFSITTI
jgi:hypothetical protein